MKKEFRLSKRIKKLQSKDFDYYNKKGISTYNFDNYKKEVSPGFIPMNRLKVAQVETRTKIEKRELNKFQLRKIFKNI